MQTTSPKARLTNLDAFRGFVVFLAFIQHYTGYLNDWYLTYFREGPAVDTIYQVHASALGRYLPSDDWILLLGRMFVPWVSLTYIALASFNLASRDVEAFKGIYRTKIQTFLALFLLFQMENAVVSLNFGHAISIYPLATWMILLALIATVYRWFGGKGVAVLFCLSWLRFILPVDGWNMGFQTWVQAQVHPGFRYNATLDLFLVPATAGFLLGWWHHQGGSWRQKLLYPLMFFGVVLCLVYLLSGMSTRVDPTNIFLNEHDAKEVIPMLGVIGLLLALIPGLVELERLGLILRVPVLVWLGAHSLLVFACHRILFVFVWAPTREWLGVLWGVPLRNTIGEVLAYCFLTIFTVWAMRALGAFRMLAK